jgi:hypothetical protein
VVEKVRMAHRRKYTSSWKAMAMMADREEMVYCQKSFGDLKSSLLGGFDADGIFAFT